MKPPKVMTDRHVRAGARALLARYAAGDGVTGLSVHRHQLPVTYQVVCALMQGLVRYEPYGADAVLRLTPEGERALAELKSGGQE